MMWHVIPNGYGLEVGEAIHGQTGCKLICVCSQLDACHPKFSDAGRKNAQRISCLPELINMLKELEWSASLPSQDGDHYQCCPWCFCTKKMNKHSDVCHLKNLLNKVK